MTENPVLKWLGVTVAVVVAIVSAVIYLEGVRAWQEVNRAILEEIRSTQQANFALGVDRFEDLESGQRDVQDAMTTSLDNLSYRLGVHAGHHGQGGD